MDSYLSQNSLKDLMASCGQSLKDGDFTDGLMLGVLLSGSKSKSEDLVGIFDEWRQSVTSMGLNSEQKMMIYNTFMMTYTKGKIIRESKQEPEQNVSQKDTVSSEPSTRKRLLKSAQKKLDEVYELEEHNKTQIASTKSHKSSYDECNSPVCPINLLSDKSKSIAESELNYEDDKPSDFEFDEEPAQESSLAKNLKKSIDCGNCEICGKNQGLVDSKTKCSGVSPHQSSVHSSCFKELVYDSLKNQKSSITCLQKGCCEMVDRSSIMANISNDALTCYDTLQFLEDFAKIGGDKDVFWCYRCRKICIRFPNQSLNCGICKKSLDKLSKLFRLVELILRPSTEDFSAKEKKSLDMIKMCISDIKTQLKKCIKCGMFKHDFNSISLKCICHQ